MTNPTISCIVPVYNVAPYIEDCLDSLNNQTRPFYEIILVNDGSTDGSDRICESYCNRCENMRLVTQENQGPSMARNNGMLRATGDYISFLDSDDYLRLDYVETLTEQLQRHPVDVLGFGAETFYELEGYTEADSFYQRADVICNQQMTGMNMLELMWPDDYTTVVYLSVYRRHFLEERQITFVPGIYFEDNPFTLEVLLKADSVYYISEQLYDRRFRSDSIMTSAITEKKCIDQCKINYEMWQLLEYGLNRQLSQEVAQSFFMYLVSGAMSYLSAYKDQLGGTALFEEYNCALREEYEHILGESAYSIDSCMTLLCLSENLVDEEKMKNDYRALADAARRVLIELPLSDQAKTVGIYGIGKHTLALIRLQEALIGPIQAKYYFIMTKKDREEYMGHLVYEPDEIPENTDAVIISSKPYQEEMKETILDAGFPEEGLITLYSNRDIYGLNTVADRLFKE